MKRALITNDDGIASPGLRCLAQAAMRAGYEVVVAAPAHEASGSSAAMSALSENGHIAIEEHDIRLPGVPAFAVEGSPGLIALIATRGGFGEPPDVVLSGINRGANAGHAVLHSGTVGAALTAAANGCRAMAVSLDLFSSAEPLDLDEDPTTGDDRRHWQTAGHLTELLLPVLAELADLAVLNLNVPDLPVDRLRGLRQAVLGRFGQVQMAIVEKGAGFVRTSLEETSERHDPGTDMAFLAEGYATLTALRPLGEDGYLFPDLDQLMPSLTAAD